MILDDSATGTSAVLPRIEKALENLASSFAVDDYRLSIAGFSDGVLKLTIDAGPSACAECLVPENILSGIIRNTLPQELPVSKIEIEYPSVSK